MKPRVVAVSFLLWVNVAAQAQVFDAGYTFTYYFPALPSYQTQSGLIDTGLFVTGYQPVTATIKWEIFDSLPSGAPVHSGIWNPGNVGWASFNDTWLDGEGAFRISILSGSQVIQNYFLYVQSPNPTVPGYTAYSAIVPSAPVPEPAGAALLVLGTVILGLVARRRFVIKPGDAANREQGCD